MKNFVYVEIFSLTFGGSWSKLRSHISECEKSSVKHFMSFESKAVWKMISEKLNIKAWAVSRSELL